MQNIEIKISNPLEINIKINSKIGKIYFDENFVNRGAFTKPLLDFHFFEKAFLNLEDGLIEWPNSFAIALSEIEFILETSNEIFIN